MMKKHRDRRQRSVYWVFLLSYVSILLIALSSAVVSYWQLDRVVTQETDASRQMMLSQLSEQLADKIASAKKLSNDIVFNKKLEQVARGLGTYTYEEIRVDIAAQDGTLPFLIDYFAYITATDRVLTPSSIMKADQFFSLAYTQAAPDADSMRELCLTGYYYQRFLPVQSIRCYGQEVRQVLFFVQSFPITVQGDPLGQVVLMADATQLFAQAARIAQSTQGAVYVYDKYDILIYATPGAPQELPQDAIRTEVAGGDLGWTFILSIPSNVYYQANREHALFFGALLLVYLVGGLVIIQFLMRRTYRPVDELHTLAKETGAALGKGNEFDVIKQAFITQMQNDSSMKEVIQSQRPIVRQNHLYRVMRGLAVDYAASAQGLEELGVHFETPLFIVAILSLSLDSPYLEQDGDVDEERLSLAHVALRELGDELLRKNFLSYSIALSHERDGFLINVLENTQNASELVRAAMRTLCDMALSEMDLYLTVGIGTQKNSLRSVQISFIEADKALGGTDDESVRVFVQSEQGAAQYYYPLDTEYRLQDLIREGNSEKARQLLGTVLALNLQERRLPAQQQHQFVYEVAFTLAKALNSNLTARRMEERPAEQVVAQALGNADVQDALLKLCDDACQMARPVSRGRTEILVEQIAEYIENNAPTATLDTLSDAFQVTPQYISNVFKKYKQVNVKDYIAAIRLEKAKELLLTTQLPVREIALQLGYANETGIIRLFKKYENTTPGEYRQRGQG